jgi:hypothetical protein
MRATTLGAARDTAAGDRRSFTTSNLGEHDFRNRIIRATWHLPNELASYQKMEDPRLAYSLTCEISDSKPPAGS